MEMRTEVRRRVLTGELSKRAACLEFGVNWRTLAKMLARAEPPGYRRRAKREKPFLGPHVARIHEMLELDRQAPKRRHHSNSYWVPVKFAYRTITVVATVDDVKMVFEDRLIARHRRHWGRDRFVLRPDPLSGAPGERAGAFYYARPLADWQLPECLNILRRRMERTPDGLGTREFIRVLLLLEKASIGELASAVDSAMELGVADADTIRVILEHRRESPVALFCLDSRPHLKLVHVPPTDIGAYASLLGQEVTA